MSYVNFTPTTSDPCSIELAIVNDDSAETPLDSSMFVFNQFTRVFKIKPQLGFTSGLYDLKIIVTVINDPTQKLDHLFSVRLID